ncbi:lysophospholipase L1-like esterase [Terracoccus luteus]|uniref:Lysophospholipase L1-like esterase n=1 Tax=Terracoccus luteus TaxID=53356 RepID=A0A495XS47_9MICO|nr:GDSL-type esterase/lipase family protein [Terracoccus luteus]RKT77330.1 lysophospholipase L1-like esterase [Terracoccus luteus]
MSDTRAGDDGVTHEFGVGPAYPTAHTQFTNDTTPVTGGRRPHPDTGSPTGAHATSPAGPTFGSDATAPVPTFAPSPESLVTEGVRDVGMAFVGASLVAGYGDPKGLGWVGRVVARTQHPDLDLTAYNLGVRGDTSGDVVARWGAECHPRWKGRAERRLVLSVGAGDITSGMTMARSRLNLANVVDEATNAGIGVFVVGLAPTLDPEQNRRVEALAEAQADVCARRGVTYVDCYRPLVGHDQWMADLAASPDRVHPGQAGYGLIAWLVLHNGWNDWLQLG